jgi:hypothetical protein
MGKMRICVIKRLIYCDGLPIRRLPLLSNSRIYRHCYATSKRNNVISMVTVSYSENKPTAIHCEWTTDVSPVTNPFNAYMNSCSRCLLYRSSSPTLRQEFWSEESVCSRRQRVRQRVSEPACEESRQRVVVVVAEQLVWRVSQREPRE